MSCRGNVRCGGRCGASSRQRRGLPPSSPTTARSPTRVSGLVMHLTTGSGKVTPNNPAERCRVDPRPASAPRPGDHGVGSRRCRTARAVVFTGIRHALATPCSGVSYHDLHATLKPRPSPSPASLCRCPRPTWPRRGERRPFRLRTCAIVASAGGSVVVLKDSAARSARLPRPVALLPYGVELPAGGDLVGRTHSSHQPLRLFFSDVAAHGPEDTFLASRPSSRQTNQSRSITSTGEHMYESGGAAYCRGAVEPAPTLSLADPAAILDALACSSTLRGARSVAAAQQGRSFRPATVTGAHHVRRNRLPNSGCRWSSSVFFVAATQATDPGVPPAHMIEIRARHRSGGRNRAATPPRMRPCRRRPSGAPRRPGRR